MIQSKSKVPEVHLAAKGLKWFHITIEGGGRKDRTRQKFGNIRLQNIPLRKYDRYQTSGCFYHLHHNEYIKCMIWNSHIEDKYVSLHDIFQSFLKGFPQYLFLFVFSNICKSDIAGSHPKYEVVMCSDKVYGRRTSAVGEIKRLQEFPSHIKTDCSIH